jgi:hypothetical protein
VNDFDHHCKWLNNCIGGANYRLFIALIWSVFVCELTLLVSCLYLIILYHSDTSTFKARTPNGYVPEVVLALCYGIGVVAFGVACQSLNLIVLHFFLCFKGLTTYEHIMNRRAQLRRKVAIAPPTLHVTPTLADFDALKLRTPNHTGHFDDKLVETPSAERQALKVFELSAREGNVSL